MQRDTKPTSTASNACDGSLIGATLPKTPLQDAADEFVDFCEKKFAGSALVCVRQNGEDGKGSWTTIKDWYRQENGPNGLRPYPTINEQLDPVCLMSSSKSIASFALFVLLTKLQNCGRQFDLNEPLCTALDWREWSEPPKDKITTHHLLTHTAGLPGAQQAGPSQVQFGFGINDPLWERSDGNGGRVTDGDLKKMAMDLELNEELIGTLNYSNPGAQLIEKVIEDLLQKHGKAASLNSVSTAEAFIEEHVFTPLGINAGSYRFIVRHQGGVDIHGTIGLVPMEFVKFGQIMADNGMWKGEKLIAPEFIDKMTTRYQARNERYSCGYLWWIDNEGGWIHALGSDNNNMHIHKDNGIVLVRTQQYRVYPPTTASGPQHDLYEEYIKTLKSYWNDLDGLDLFSKFGRAKSS